MPVRVSAVTTNASGEVVVQLCITNALQSAALVAVRSIIYQAQGSWVTNFDIHPRLVGLAGPGSQASDVTLAAGEGITATLSPFQAPAPFQLELICFPSRSGIGGAIDGTKDKVGTFKDGSRHESYLGNSFFVLSPLISPQTQPDRATNAAQPPLK